MNNTPTLFDTLIGVTCVALTVLIGASCLKFLATDFNDRRPIIQAEQTCTTFLWGGCTTNNGK
jgi:hypothetical protein